MGLTLIRKSTAKSRPRNPQVALVLAGGAVSGGAFKVGGLKALDDYLVGRRIVDLDMYLGLSAGAMLAVPLASGIGPDEMIKVLEGTSSRFDQLTPMHFYNPNLREFAERPARFLYDAFSYFPGLVSDLVRVLPDLPEHLAPVAKAFLARPSYTRAEEFAMELMEKVSPGREIPMFTNHIPAGLFDNVSLERWLAQNLTRIRMPNDFREFEAHRSRRLYVTACALDTAERVIFGADEKHDVSISQAVQASTALPIFYKPARVDGVDYVDGGIRNTANIDVAIDKGADLVICYNPFRPFLNRTDAERTTKFFSAGRTLADRGLKMVINQVFRTLLHSRLRIALQRYISDDAFQGDIVLLEPREHDSEFFDINPMAFWKRADAIREGFESVRGTIDHHFDELEQVLAPYGLHMDAKIAKRRASRLRASRGWRVTRPDPRRGGGRRPDLRLVQSG